MPLEALYLLDTDPKLSNDCWQLDNAAFEQGGESRVEAISEALGTRFEVRRQLRLARGSCSATRTCKYSRCSSKERIQRRWGSQMMSLTGKQDIISSFSRKSHDGLIS